MERFLTATKLKTNSYKRCREKWLLIIFQIRSLQPYLKVERVRACRSLTGRLRLFHSTELQYS